MFMEQTVASLFAPHVYRLLNLSLVLIFDYGGLSHPGTALGRDVFVFKVRGIYVRGHSTCWLEMA